MTSFVRFHEYNDHEGERWNWWLQVDGNSSELAKLHRALDDIADSIPYDLWYELSDDEEPDWAVDLLCDYGDEGGRYHPLHTKVTGKFTCPGLTDEDDLNELLYKGGIRDFFKDE